MGARRFIFEGKECGGHVGPRSSFVLWESMIETLLHGLNTRPDLQELHVVFAGGIHDSLSAAMVAAMSAPLVERGVRVGILMGTAYLFTAEAVASGAIVQGFQEAALRCQETVLLETGPGHAIRCLNSPYKKIFDEKRRELEAGGYGKNELRQELELMNLGRLRIASKGLARGDSGSKTGSRLVQVSDDRQWSEGMYMIGQIAVLHEKTTGIKDLHESVSTAADSYLKSLAAQSQVAGEGPARKKREPIAIVGMSCLFPKANNVETYWQNILNKVDCIEEIPLDRWDWSLLYSEEMLSRDKIYSKWGGFLGDIPFDPSIYGIPPASLSSIDPMQLLILEVTRSALHDAGYQNRPFPKNRTSIILANAGHGPITAFYSLRSMLDWTLSDLDPEYRKVLEKRLPEWTEDSFPGYLGNVVAGRVANRFDLGGINFCIDAACASSLAALYSGMQELRSGSSDMVLLAATDTHNQPGDYLSFSKTMALSPRGRCRTFDASADGIAISEGIAVLVLKRLSDAERDGDRVYALIKGIGGSSDGRDLSLTAPRPAGQMVALARAYQDADVSPSTVELVEAHGTGTVAGDRAEVEALRNVFEESGADRRVCALGSVKTMIGHSKCAAGLASIIKVAQSLYHKVLPPTMGVDTPNPACNFESSPFYLNTEARPWLHASPLMGSPRRAGVSAFGFGGTNFHTVLEEYAAQELPRQDGALRHLPTELFCLQAGSRAQLLRQIENLENGAGKVLDLQKQPAGPLPSLQPASLLDLAYRHHIAQSQLSGSLHEKGERRLQLALVAASADDLLRKLEQARQLLLDETKTDLRDPRGLFFQESEAAAAGLVAFLFPGQGSQHLNMLKDLSLSFAEIRRTFESADGVLSGRFEEKLSNYVYPAPAFTDEERRLQSERLTNTHVAQPAVGAADMAAFALLLEFGLAPDMCAGHSFGEYVALAAAKVMSAEDLFKISEQRGAILKAANDKMSGSMTAVSANGDEVRRLIANLGNVTLANINSPRQCIISGEKASLAEAGRVFEENKIKSKPIAVSAAFHSPLMEPALKELSEALLKVNVRRAQTPVFSNTLAGPYPQEPNEIVSLLCEHLVKPVEFQRQIERMYEAGARIFIECGPGAVLSSLVDDILEGKEHLCLPLERSTRNGITQLQFVLAQAFVSGLPVDFSKLYKHRIETPLSRSEESGSVKKPRLTYLINASHIKRYDGKTAVPSSRPTELAMQVAAQKQGQARQSGPAKPAAVQSHLADRARADAHPAAARQDSAKSVNTGAPRQSAAEPANSPAKTAPFAGVDLQPRQGGAVKETARGQMPQAPLAGGRGQREQVMLEFQRSLTQMTNNFLQTQERVMMAYLQPGSLPAQAQPLLPAGRPELLPAFNLPDISVPSAQESALPGATSSQAASGVLRRASEVSAVNPEISATASAPIADRAEPTEADTVPAGAGLRLDAEALIAQLVQIVAERTGYPPEMLDPSLDLEADLGIDSIKRVEILNNFRKLLPEEVQIQLESGIEKLAGSKTLQSIMDWIRSDLVSGAPAPAIKSGTEAAAATAADTVSKSRAYVGRALVRVKELPVLPPSRPELHGLYIITDPENGLAEELAAKLIAAGADTLILRHRDSQPPEKLDLPASRWQADLCREDLVRDFARKISDTYEHVSGLIHLWPLQSKFQATTESGDFSASFGMVRSLFVLSRELLVPLSKDGKSIKLFAASNLGGNFAQSSDGNFNPVQAAIPGLLKSYAREYPHSFVRALDFSTNLALPACADLILSELGQSDSELVEVGYLPNRRITLEAVPQVLQAKPQPRLELDSSSVVLVTGGARGITAEICLELAEKHRPVFVIIGRAPRPDAVEDPDYQGLTGVRDIKAAIMDKLRRAGSTLSVPAVESIYQKLIKEREIRSNLARLEAAGSRVQYHALDVRDRPALTALIDRLYDSFGKIDAVIHGAGIIEDAFLKDKSLASFDRVFQTKVESALTLCSRLDLDRLKYLIFFSSVVSRTGNAGQCDYVAANEVLNKLALRMNSQSKARVTSILWGPWRGGMAQSELESVFALYGWAMIEPGDGRLAFYNELAAGLKPEAEVLLVGQVPGDLQSDSRGLASETTLRSPQVKISAGTKKHAGEIQKVQPGATAPDTSAAPDDDQSARGKNGDGEGAQVQPRGARLHRAEILKQEADKLLLRVRIDPEFDVFLKDHTFDGVPVLPMAVATELLAETARLTYPDWRLDRLENLDIPAGIMFERGARDLYLNLAELTASCDQVEADLNLCTSPDAARKNFMARAVLTRDFSDLEHGNPGVLPAYRLPEFKEAEAVLPTVTEIYTNWLFHGPLFQGIVSIDAMGVNGIAGRLQCTPVEECLSQTVDEPWLVDPLLLDSGMQLAGVWARHYMGVTALPTGFKKLHLCAPRHGSFFQAIVFIPEESKNGQLTCDLAIYDEDGKMVMLMEGLGGVGNKALNRLASAPKALRAR
jgi:acyl transferase domain-containing protein/NADP-dependent 3-hydroxy acid dehydrogenase YdfG